MFYTCLSVKVSLFMSKYHLKSNLHVMPLHTGTHEQLLMSSGQGVQQPFKTLYTQVAPMSKAQPA